MHTIIGGTQLSCTPATRAKTQRIVVNAVLLLLLAVSLFGYFTERKLARSTASIYGAALEAAKAGRWYWDIKDDRLMWDDNMLKIWGITREQFTEDYDIFINSIHPEDREVVDKEVKRCIANKAGYRSVFRIITPEGEVKTIAVAGQVSKDGYYMTGINMPHSPIPKIGADTFIDQN